MTKDEAKAATTLGLYWIFWKAGGSSLAAVGQLNDGTRWFAPTNWTNKSPEGIASVKWALVARVEQIDT